MTNDQTTNNQKKDDGLFGVACEVMSCKYHEPGNLCCAQSITVEAPDASKKVETYCGTFAPNAQQSQAT
ncbi:MAG: DUF1540 domain-containing protein [Oscillospiraceae bacterium]|jgi:hypothetical protein|nr:DUF1540 domain-containing protein [Oscillospiraceae bacterium]